MQDLPLAVPLAIGAVSTQLDTGAIDPSTIVGRLSSTLTTTDTFDIFGTQDPAATGASPNLSNIARIRGTNGSAGSSPLISGWRYLFLRRVDGYSAGFFFASGNNAPATAVAPASVAVPAAGSFAELSVASFRSPIKVALGGNFTSADIIEVYATDDSTGSGLAGSTLIGVIQGGGSPLSPANTNATPSQFVAGTAPSLPGVAYSNLVFRRAQGFTAGSVYAWGATDGSNSGGGSSPATLNKTMVGILTTADGQPATDTPVASLPVGWVGVYINGILYEPGNATRTAVACYFSGDGGATPRAQGAIQVGDLCYWNGSYAGFQLASTDVVDFVYNSQLTVSSS